MKLSSPYIGGGSLTREHNLHERLDRLKALIQDEDFLAGKGLSNEVNIRIFCYPPEDELTVAYFLRQLLEDKGLGCQLLECNLYQIFIEICEDMDILDSIPEMEAEDGSSYLLEQLHSAIGENEFIEKMQEKYPPRPGSVMLLTGVGDVFPFMRVHKMLEAMQPHFSEVPILVMYPGAFDGNYLRLFERLTPSPYYRAFNVV